MKNKNRLLLSIISLILLIIIIGCNLNEPGETVEEKRVTLTIRVNGPLDSAVPGGDIVSARIEFKNAEGNLVTSADIKAQDFGTENKLSVTQSQVDGIKSVSVVSSWLVNGNAVDTIVTSNVSLNSGYHYIDVTITDLSNVVVVVDTGDPYSRQLRTSGNPRTLSTNSFAISEF
ncbi:MAG: hypothetical protein JXR70_13595 [Spirochaetales bacterium]|nr:hypothetical protein [Spirochaetales bacterium]